MDTHIHTPKFKGLCRPIDHFLGQMMARSVQLRHAFWRVAWQFGAENAGGNMKEMKGKMGLIFQKRRMSSHV